MDNALLFTILACFAASIVQAVSGLGYTIVMMSILPFFLAYRTANIVTVISAVFVLMMTAFSLRKHINYRLLVIPVICSLVARTISLYLLTVLPDAFLSKFSGAFLVLIAIYLMFFSKKVSLKPTKLNGGIIGFFAGLFGGLTNISGPIFVVYYLPAAKNTEEYAGTLQVSFMIGCLYTVFINASRGNITGEVLWLGLLGSLGAILGIFIGIKILKSLNKDRLRKVICVIILVMGCLQLV